MATSRILYIQTFAASAKDLGATANPTQTLTQMLASIRNAIFQNEIQDGKIIVATAEAGGSVTFSIQPGQTPMDVAALAQETLAWCNQFPTPDNPTRGDGTSALLPKRIKRLRASFKKATI